VQTGGLGGLSGGFGGRRQRRVPGMADLSLTFFGSFGCERWVNYSNKPLTTEGASRFGID
ncbi:MAG TPA: hypothetical protein VI386_05160, partial [Candidatus Sulfotelmatobacter sp.]